MARLSRTICGLIVLLTAISARGEPVASLITVGPGDAVWERFGHNMIRVRDDASGFDACFNWGLFDFDQPNFIGNFVKGRMLYTMAPLDTARSLDLYRSQDRHVTEQRLLLSPRQVRDLLVRCDRNFRVDPDYRYDYFKDNCSTRVRDMLDGVGGNAMGGLTAGRRKAPPTTYRREALRLLQADFWASLGLDFAGGPNIDKPLDRRAEGFVPEAVAIAAQEAGLADAPVDLWPSRRPPPPRAPPERWPGLLAVGLAWAAAVVLSGRRSIPLPVFRGRVREGARPEGATSGDCAPSLTLPRNTGRGDLTAAALDYSRTRRAWLRPAIARLLRGLPVTLWWLVSGFGGLFMVYLWALTDHTAGYANQNLWHFSPLAWLVLGLTIFRRHRAARRVAVVIAAGSILGVGVWAAGMLGGPLAQANGGFILLALPVNLAVGWARRSALTKPASADDMTA